MAVLQAGYGLGKEEAYKTYAFWENVCQETDLYDLDGQSSLDDALPMTCLYYRLQQASYLPAEPDLGSVAENAAR